MFRRLLSVGGFTLLSRITGFVRDVIMAAILGAGPASDAFLVAFRLPNNFRAIFGEGAFNAAFIPRYAAANATDGPGAAQRFADRVFSWQMAAQVVLLVLALACMPWIIAAMAPGFVKNPGQMVLAIQLSRIAFPYLIFTLVAVQLSAMLNAHGRFAAAAAWSIFLNVAMVATLLGSKWFPSAAYAAAWGVFGAGILQLLFILIAAARANISLNLALPRWNAETKGFLLALGAATIGSASVQISLFIDNLIASFLPSGDLTALYYADRINQLPMGTLGVALGTVLLPEMSARIARGDRAGADDVQNRSAALGLLLTLPFVAAYFAVPFTIMSGLFAHGAFHLEAAHLSGIALMAYGVGLPAFVLVRCVAPTFYARGDTATPVRATIVSVVANIALKFVLVWGLNFGAEGIALGTSLGAWTNVAMLAWLAQRRGMLTISPVFTRSLGPTLLASAVTAGGALAGVKLGAMIVPAGGSLHDEVMLAGAVILAGIGYLAVVFLFRRRLPLGRLTRTKE